MIVSDFDFTLFSAWQNIHPRVNACVTSHLLSDDSETNWLLHDYWLTVSPTRIKKYCRSPNYKRRVLQYLQVHLSLSGTTSLNALKGSVRTTKRVYDTCLCWWRAARGSLTRLCALKALRIFQLAKKKSNLRSVSTPTEILQENAKGKPFGRARSYIGLSSQTLLFYG